MENKYCDYCGDTIFIGERYYEHEDDIVCSGCAHEYAWMLFEQKAEYKYLQPKNLIIPDRTMDFEV